MKQSTWRGLLLAIACIKLPGLCVAQDSGIPFDYRPGYTGGNLAPALTGSSKAPAANSILQNSVILAKVVAAMYPAADKATEAAYTDCARPHRPRPGTYEVTAASTIASLLGTQQTDVTLFDLHSAGSGSGSGSGWALGSREQICHAAVVLVRPKDGQQKLASSRPGAPVIVVAFRGTTGTASLLPDITPASTRATFRGKAAEVHSSFYNSMFIKPALTTCDPGMPKPAFTSSCADSILSHVKTLAKQNNLASPWQIVVAGHSQGAAAAALFALHLDAAHHAVAKYDLSCYTFGQPKLGLGNSWQLVYDGGNKLSSRTYRWVHNADPVPMMPSACQTAGSNTATTYKQVGTVLRVRSPRCPTNLDNSLLKDGQCNPQIIEWAPPQCTMEENYNSYADCSIWVGYNSVTKSYNRCYCGAMPSALANELVGDHNVQLYAAGLDGCRSVASFQAAAPAMPLKCSTAASGCSVT